jgi:MFS family permease
MIGLLAGSAGWGLFWGAWAALLPGVGDQVGADPGQLGLALFAIPLGAFPAMLGMGSVFDRHGRPAFGVALLLFAVASAVPGFASGVVPLAGSLLLVGAASGAIEVGLNAATAAEEAATGQRLFNRVHALTPVAMIVGAPLAGAAREAGFTPAQVLLTVASLVAATAVPNLTRRRQLTSRSRTRGLRLSGRLLGYGLAGAGVLFVENAVEQWSAVLLEKDLGTGPFLASLGPAGYLAALSLGRFLAQRYGEGLTPRRALALAGAGAAVGVAVAATAAHPVSTLVGFGFAGLTAGPALPALLAAVGRVAGHPGVALATVTVVSYLGFLASPAVVGRAAGEIGLPGALGWVAGVGGLLAAGCGLHWVLRRRVPGRNRPRGLETGRHGSGRAAGAGCHGGADGTAVVAAAAPDLPAGARTAAASRHPDPRRVGGPTPHQRRADP